MFLCLLSFPRWRESTLASQIDARFHGHDTFKKHCLQCTKAGQLKKRNLKMVIMATMPSRQVIFLPSL